jgi:hypothetical protein
MKYEYKEGTNAKEKFEQSMKVLFGAPKTVKVGAKVKRPKKAATSRKTVSDSGEA